MRIFLSAGEASGDALATALVREIRKAGHQFSFEGIGGKRLREEIGSLVVDASRWGAISMVQALAVYPRALIGLNKAKRKLSSGTPGLLIAIDFGYFNIRICRFARKHGWKVLYFMPPSSWRRDKQGRDLPALSDAIVTPFPWSAELLRTIGGNVFFFGHPVKQMIRAWSAANSVPERVGETVAVLPGSRHHELDRNLPMIADMVNADGLDNRIEFAVAPNLDVRQVETMWQGLVPGRKDVFTQGNVYGVLGRARAAIVCSGTATLEAALMGCPHVVVYRITKAMMREAKLIRFKPPKFISLPNIVLDRELVKEFAGLEIDIAALRRAIEPLLTDGPEREAQLAGFGEVSDILGPDVAITKTAELVVEMTTAPEGKRKNGPS